MAAPAPITILYNPNSTGDSRKNARAFKKELAARGITAELKATKHAGHAEELARAFASDHPRGMVVSSSGDGGYHEVVNGVLGSKNPSVITGLLPSGNANDHYHFVHHGDTAARIVRGRSQHIDVLKVVTPDWTRYAHSYVGLGLTPQIGKELTEKRPGRLQEKWLVLKNMFRVTPVQIRVHGRVRNYSHLVLSNSGRMSKVLTLSTLADIQDGRFEISRVGKDSPFKLLGHLLRATANQISDTTQADHYSFTALRNMRIQLDGEVYTILSGQKVTITCVKQALRTIV